MRWLLLSFVLLGAGACQRKATHHVERLEVSGATVIDNAILAMSAEQVQGLLEQKLRKSGHFAFPEEGKPPPAQRVRLELELTYTREAEKEGREGTWAEVGATATVTRKSKDDARRDEVVGLGEVKVPDESPEARARAVREALEAALDQVVTSAELMLAAHGKPDGQLEKDLRHEDPRVREFALRALTERKNPAVVELLLERLQGNDAGEVRRAIGGLVELRDPRAVPALIDLARNRDASFIREIVFALGAIGGEEAEAYLFTVAQGHDQPEVQAAALQAMAELRARTSGTARPAP